MAAVQRTIEPFPPALLAAMTILLSTLNARYAHASLGLRYLYANMGALQEQTHIQEFVIGAKTTDLLERLLSWQRADEKLIIGFGVYIWNVEETTRLVALIKRVAPEIIIVLGGPEVSYETQEQAIVGMADYVITGWGDVSFPALCQQILHGPKPLMKIHAGVQAPLDQLRLPYEYYSDQDIKHRTLYVEASRGCPFKCEFCLSALDKTAWPFDIDRFLDRTFNLNIKTSLKIMQFFLDKLAANPDDPVFAHFEVVPDHLPDALKEGIQKFPAGTLQFEIGIQSFNPEVQTRISRKQNNSKAAENIVWLMQHSQAHLHVDLIAGLPGETVESFAQGFNQLHALGPHEIQFGILKRLRGTPIIRHTEDFGMRFDPYPPYTILANKDVPFAAMQRLIRFARYWDLIANSGRFTHTLPIILGTQAFENFMDLSDWIYAQTDATHKIALDRLANLVTKWLCSERGMDLQTVQTMIGKDYAGDAKHKQSPEVLAQMHVKPDSKSNKPSGEGNTSNVGNTATGKLPKRQARHLVN